MASGGASEGRKCGAKKSNGEPCASAAGLRTPHPGWGKCYRHFGCTPHMTRLAIKERITHMATEACRLLNLDVDFAHVSPEQALLEEVRRSYGVVAWFDQQIGDLEEADLTQAIIEDDGSLKAMEIAAWYRIYNTERKHLADVCAKALNAGVAEKHLALLQTQATDLARAIQAVLEGLGLNAEQKMLAPTLLRSALSQIPVAGELTA